MRYPGIEEAERQRSVLPDGYEEEPDIVETASGFAPNYDKYPGVDPAVVLAWCNMD